MEIKVRNKYNQPLGVCKDIGAIIQALSYKHGVVGWYNKSADITFEANGQIYCYGDGTAELVRKAG